MTSETLILEQQPSITDDFSNILKHYNLEYKVSDLYYFQVGEITRVQGWVLHVSVIKFQVHELLTLLIPELIQAKVPFKIIHEKTAAACLLNGQLGYPHIGKAMRIYPETDKQALHLAKILVKITSAFRGPAVPTDIHLGGTVYTRYGSFNPVLKQNEYGQAERYFYDHRGNLIKDECCIPFKMPENVTWPFSTLAPPTPLKVHGYLSVMNDSHIVTTVLKADSKGNVYKTLQMKGLWFQWCLVKEGKHDTALDEVGRDIQERLRWQYRLQNDLQGIVAVPKVYDLYEENGNTYLVMEYITGESLYERERRIHNHMTWADLDTPKKLRLIEYIGLLVSYLEILHQKGYVHRDFAPDNFLFDKRDRLVMIDLELAYSLNERYPTPPFILGTDGFMSPEQWRVDTPTEKEDIYALGAMMIILLTSFIPRGTGIGHPELLQQTLYFFLHDDDMATLITRCTSMHSESRPTLSEIKSNLSSFQSRIISAGEVIKTDVYNRTTTKKVVQDSINALGSATLSGQERLWFSNPIGSRLHVVNEQNGRLYYMGISSGIGGVIYTLARAKKLGIELEGVMPTLKNNYEYALHFFLTDIKNAPPGLYFGSYGLAMALCESIQNKLFEDQKGILREKIESCLKLVSESLDISTGIAGQGIALLHYRSCYNNSKDMDILLQHHIDLLLNTQQKDGSWLCSSGKKETGLSHGVAGIAVFLLKYYQFHSDSAIAIAIERSLSWLRKQAIKQKSNYLWYINDKTKSTSPKLHDGYVGIALCFIRAFELFKDPLFEDIATKALLNHPERPIHRTLGLTNGLAGLGETYLEAKKVFDRNIWQDRSDWIAQVIGRTSCYQSDDSCYWHTDHENPPTADLMIGNSGVTHFLMRYEAKGRLNFPVL